MSKLVRIATTMAAPLPQGWVITTYIVLVGISFLLVLVLGVIAAPPI
jgi:hypothetical protein